MCIRDSSNTHTTSNNSLNSLGLSLDLSQTLTLSDSQSQLLTPQFSPTATPPRTPISLSPGDEYTGSDRGLLGFFENAREPETRMPRGWYEGDWDGVADCEPNEPDQGREFILTGHVNLNRSGACAAMFAKHQADETARFKLDDKGNIISRAKILKNPKRDGKPLSVSEWERDFKGKEKEVLAMENGGNNKVSCVVVESPQPKSPEGWQDTWFYGEAVWPKIIEAPDLKDPRLMGIGHYNVNNQPPSSAVNSYLYGFSMKMLLDSEVGATHFRMFIINFRDGGSSYDATKTTTSYISRISGILK